MKILWVCNTLLPHVAKVLNIQVSKPESWILGAYEKIKNREELSLTYLFPYDGPSQKYIEGQTTFISYPQKNPNKFEKKQTGAFSDIFTQCTPDVIHIFGSEYPHSYAAVLAAKWCDLLSRTVIHIQGLCSVIAKHYFACLPFRARHGYTLRDFLRGENVYGAMRSFCRRGKCEKKAIASAFHVIGRTDWDYACSKMYNPDVQYHFCNETLRPAFYENMWDYEKCEKHSIFVSQCSYPLKGFHLMLEAMHDIVKIYPDAKLYTTGKNPLSLSFKQKLRQSYYNKYLGKLIRRYGLENNVVFLGFLDERSMCEAYKRANVFVSCSSIENSSNSVGEAMILGVPAVSSDVGGIKNLLDHGKEGYLYQADAPYMLVHYIEKIFEDKDTTLVMSVTARERARTTHDPERNFAALISTYQDIITKG